MDILLCSLSNAFQRDATLYQNRGNFILVDKLKPGRVESTYCISNMVMRSMTKIFTPSVIQFTETKPLLLVHIKNSTRNSWETTSYLHDDKHLSILSKQIEALSVEKVYIILIGEKDNDKIFEKVSHGVERSDSFLIDISNLKCLDDLKSNDREAMSHHGQALRQISIDENGEIAIRRKRTEDDHEDKWLYLYEYVSKTKRKEYCLCIYTLWNDTENCDYIDMLLYNFKLILIKSRLQHLMETVRNPVNLIQKQCWVQLKVWKCRWLARIRSQHILI